jgi:hypothetical protein
MPGAFLQIIPFEKKLVLVRKALVPLAEKMIFFIHMPA